MVQRLSILVCSALGVLACSSDSDDASSSVPSGTLELTPCAATGMPSDAKRIRGTPDGVIYAHASAGVVRLVPSASAGQCAFDVDPAFGENGVLDVGILSELAVDGDGYLHADRHDGAGEARLVAYDPQGNEFASCAHDEIFLGTVLGVTRTGHSVFMRTFDGPMLKLQLGVEPCSAEPWNPDARLSDAQLIESYDNQLVVALTDALFVTDLQGQPTAGPIADDDIQSPTWLCFVGDVSLRDAAFDVADPNCADVKRYSLDGAVTTKFESPDATRVASLARAAGVTYALSRANDGTSALHRVEGLD